MTKKKKMRITVFYVDENNKVSVFETMNAHTIYYQIDDEPLVVVERYTTS